MGKVKNNNPPNQIFILLITIVAIVGVGAVIVSNSLSQKTTENRSKATFNPKIAPENASFEKWDSLPRVGDIHPGTLFPTKWTKGWGWLTGKYSFNIEQSSDKHDGNSSAKITAVSDIKVEGGVPLLQSNAGIIGLTVGSYRASVWHKYSCKDPNAPAPTGRLRIESSVSKQKRIVSINFTKDWSKTVTINPFTVQDASPTVHQLLQNDTQGQLGSFFLDVSTISKDCSVFFDDASLNPVSP